MNNELISVVLTSYNHKEYLDSAIRHILAQSYKNIELVIIDDCSTDGSQEVIKKYLNDSRVKAHLLESNLGSYVKSTNLGASYATGEYVNFAQCDDYSDFTLIERLYSVINEHPQCDVAYSASYLIDEHDTIIGNDFDCRSESFKRNCSNDTVIDGKQMRQFLYQSCVVPNLSAVLINRELFNSVGGLSSEFLVLADWDMWIRLTYKTQFFYVRDFLNYFRQHSTTIRSRISLKKQLKELFLMHKRNILAINLTIEEKLGIYYNVALVWLAFSKDNFYIWMRILPSLVIFSMKLSALVSLFLPFVALKIVTMKICKRLF